MASPEEVSGLGGVLSELPIPRTIRQFTMAGTLQVAKLWHAGFSYVQTSSKPCSNLNSMGPDHASRCDTILKESSINFFFCARQV